jgi:hypothetical protein
LFVLNLVNRVSIVYGTSFPAMLQYSIQRLRPTAQNAFAALESFDPSEMLGFLGSTPLSDSGVVPSEVELPAAMRTDEQIRDQIRDLQLRIQGLEGVLAERQQRGTGRRQEVGRTGESESKSNGRGVVRGGDVEAVSHRLEGLDSSLHLQASHEVVGFEEVALQQQEGEEGEGWRKSDEYGEVDEDKIEYDDEVTF